MPGGMANERGAIERLPSRAQGKTIVDVTGWAPTADTLNFVSNKCTDESYGSNFTIVQGDDVAIDDVNGAAKGPNDLGISHQTPGYKAKTGRHVVGCAIVGIFFSITRSVNSAVSG